jgi:hypothetical protein
MWRIQSAAYSIQHRKPSQVDLAPARVALQNELIQRFSLHDSLTNRVHPFARIVRRDLGATLRAFELSFASDLGQIYSVEPDSLHLNLLQYYIGCCESKTLTEHCYRRGQTYFSRFRACVLDRSLMGSVTMVLKMDDSAANSPTIQCTNKA